MILNINAERGKVLSVNKTGIIQQLKNEFTLSLSEEVVKGPIYQYV